MLKSHGQKQTVLMVVDDEHMLICTDVRTGRKFTPDVVTFFICGFYNRNYMEGHGEVEFW